MEAIHRARSFGGDATVLADYALTTTTSDKGANTAYFGWVQATHNKIGLRYARHYQYLS